MIVERAGKRIGIFGLLGSKLKQAKVKEPKSFDVERIARRADLQILEWKQTARSVIDELLPRTDLIFCASHLGFDGNRALARAFPEVDLVFGGHFGQAEKATNVVKDTPVLIPLVRGSRVDRVEWWWDEPSDYFRSEARRREEGHGKLENVSNHRGALVNVEVQRHEHEGMLARELAHPAEDYERLLGDKWSLLVLAEQAVEELPPMPDGNRFAHVQVAMHRDIPRSDHALAAVDAYHATVHEMWSSRVQDTERATPSRYYVGPDECAECHPRQVEFWKATRHSFALTALEASNQHLDAECFPCHTVGWNRTGGFRKPGRHDGFENVQCAACHGPTGPHVAGGTSYIDKTLMLRMDSTTCMECHNEEHDPNFETKGFERLAKVACPSMSEPAQRPMPLREATARAALILENAPQPPWGLISETFRKAHLPDRSLEAARSWVAERPKNAEANLMLGNRLLELDRYEESLPYFETVTRRTPGEAGGWAGLALALAKTDPDRADLAAREAFSLAPNDPMTARVSVEILLLQGRVSAAVELAAGMITTYPQLAPVLAELIDLEQVFPAGVPEGLLKVLPPEAKAKLGTMSDAAAPDEPPSD